MNLYPIPKLLLLIGVNNAFTVSIEVLAPGSEVVAATPGNNILTGNNDLNDTLIGVNAADLNPGQGEIDELTGWGGVDIFVLGDSSKVYYDDTIDSNPGLDDYALITDFSVGQRDIIQLHGSADQYQLGGSPEGLDAGTAIFLNTAEEDELIAIVQGNNDLVLDSPAFRFV